MTGVVGTIHTFTKTGTLWNVLPNSAYDVHPGTMGILPAAPATLCIPVQTARVARRVGEATFVIFIAVPKVGHTAPSLGTG